MKRKLLIGITFVLVLAAFSLLTACSLGFLVPGYNVVSGYNQDEEYHWIDGQEETKEKHDFELLFEYEADFYNEGRESYQCRTCGYLLDITTPKITIEYRYDKDSNGYLVSNVSMDVTDLIIPDTYKGLPVIGFDNGVHLGGIWDIQTVKFGENIKQIPKDLFNNNHSLKEVVIPGSVETIGDYAFSQCENLSTVVIADGVKTIGDYAFSGCSSLETVKLPANIEMIGNGMFSNCTSLSTITIPETVHTIGYYAFSDSGLKEITIPSGVTYIGDYAFYKCNDLTTLSILCEVASIGEYAFDDCGSLTDLSIPTSAISHFNNENIRTIVFTSGSELKTDYMTMSNLRSVTIPSSVRSITGGGFYNSSHLYEIFNYSSLPITAGSDDYYGIAYYAKVVYTEPHESGYYVDDGFDLFTYEDGKLLLGYTGEKTQLVLPKGVTEIAVSAFYKVSGITSVVMPESLTLIDDYAFSECVDLTSISFNQGLTSIGERAFFNCKKLSELILPSTLTSIGEYSFYQCGITNLTIPDGLTEIGYRAFYSCRITQATLPISALNFINNRYLTKVVLTSGEEIPAFAFGECKDLTDVTIPSSVTVIYEDAFFNTGLYLDENNWENGLLYLGDWLIGADSSVEEFTISADDKVASGAFKYSSLKKVTIEDGVEIIGGYMFSDCEYLESVSIPSTVTTIDNYAFVGCYNLKLITLPVSVTTIGYAAFSGCGRGEFSVIYEGTDEQWDAIDANELSGLPESYIRTVSFEILANAVNSRNYTLTVDQTTYAYADGMIANGSDVYVPTGTDYTQYTFVAENNTVRWEVNENVKDAEKLYLIENGVYADLLSADSFNDRYLQNGEILYSFSSDNPLDNGVTKRSLTRTEKGYTFTIEVNGETHTLQMENIGVTVIDTPSNHPVDLLKLTLTYYGNYTQTNEGYFVAGTQRALASRVVGKLSLDKCSIQKTTYSQSGSVESQSTVYAQVDGDDYYLYQQSNGTYYKVKVDQTQYEKAVAEVSVDQRQQLFISSLYELQEDGSYKFNGSIEIEGQVFRDVTFIKTETGAVISFYIQMDNGVRLEVTYNFSNINSTSVNLPTNYVSV
ncbi:MAG: leucine-rich repeat domain-containing protein [Clostridia bacterium]|nr:leucine-rich repeat domain-containing protein [Clostridia bacterium]